MRARLLHYYKTKQLSPEQPSSQLRTNPKTSFLFLSDTPRAPQLFKTVLSRRLAAPVRLSRRQLRAGRGPSPAAKADSRSAPRVPSRPGRVPLLTPASFPFRSGSPQPPSPPRSSPPPHAAPRTGRVAEKPRSSQPAQRPAHAAGREAEGGEGPTRARPQHCAQCADAASAPPKQRHVTRRRHFAPSEPRLAAKMGGRKAVGAQVYRRLSLCVSCSLCYPISYSKAL